MKKLIEGMGNHKIYIIWFVFVFVATMLFLGRTYITDTLTSTFPSKATQYYAKIAAEEIQIVDIKPPAIAPAEVLTVTVVPNKEYKKSVDGLIQELKDEGNVVGMNHIVDDSDLPTESEEHEARIDEYYEGLDEVVDDISEELEIARLNIARIDELRRETDNLNAIIKGLHTEIDRRANHLACSKIISRLHWMLPNWTPEGFIDLVLWNDIVKYCGALRTKYP